MSSKAIWKSWMATDVAFFSMDRSLPFFWTGVSRLGKGSQLDNGLHLSDG